MRRWLIGLGALLVAAHGAPAQTIKTCNGLIHLDFAQTGPGTGRARIELGAGAILGGTALLINSVDFNLDCNANFPLTPPCTDEGAVVSYGGDGTITTTCPGITWNSGHPIGTSPNVVVFTATPVLVVPANSVTPPGKCNLEFDLTLVGTDTDGSGAIEELANYNLTLCDNGLTSAGFQTIAIVGTTTTTTSTTSTTTSSTTTTTTTSTTTSSKTTSTKTTTTTTTSSTTSTTMKRGECEGKEKGTPCTDTDHNACTIAACKYGRCDQDYDTVHCPPADCKDDGKPRYWTFFGWDDDCRDRDDGVWWDHDGKPCQCEQTCNPHTGMCELKDHDGK